MKYLYGEEIEYEYDLLKPEDYDKLQAFSCGNKNLDYYIHKDLIRNDEVDTEDGLPFKVWDKKTADKERSTDYVQKNEKIQTAAGTEGMY